METTVIAIIGAALLPAIVAISRGHNSHLAIIATTLIACVAVFMFFPVGVALWCFALIWSLTGNVTPKKKAKIFGKNVYGRNPED